MAVMYTKQRPSGVDKIRVFGEDLPRRFKVAKQLNDVLLEVCRLLNKEGKLIEVLVEALNLAVKYIPPKSAANFMPASLFGVPTGISPGAEIPKELLRLIAFAAGCGLIIGGVVWWMKANKLDFVNNVLKPAYEAVIVKQESDGVVVSAVLATFADMVMAVAPGPVGCRLGLGAAAGYGVYCSVRALRDRVAGMESQEQQRCGHQETFSDKVFDEELSSRNIPYLPCQLINGQMEGDGAELHIAGVSAWYSPGALPLRTNICMMVRPIDEGYCFKDVMFSPQAILGPHLGRRLVKPLTLRLPLEVRGKVTALVSKTAAEDTPQWEVIPESSVEIFKDEGYVQVATYDHCRYQVQSGNCTVNVLSEYVYFSLSAKLQQTTHLLQLHCSGNKDLCKQSRGDFKLCHHPDDIRGVEVIDGDEVFLSIVSSDESIVQLSSPFTEEKLRCVLDEQFSIRVGVKRESSQSEEGWLVRIFSFLRLSQKRESPGRMEKYFPWHFILPNGYGEGFLEVYSKHLSEVDGVHSRGSSSALTFKVSHTGSGQQLQSPASNPNVVHKPEEPCVIQQEGYASSGTGRSPCRRQQTDPTAKCRNDPTAPQAPSSSRNGGQPSLSAGHHNSSTMSPQQQGVMLRDIRNPLFPLLADTQRPFSLEWKKIFRSLPIVASVEESSRRSGLQLAYPYPESEIDNIKSNIQTQYGCMNNSECLQAALNKWLNDRGGYASVGHLFDVLASSTVNLSSSAQTFFEDYFRNHHHKLQ